MANYDSAKPLYRHTFGKPTILVVDGDLNSSFYMTTLLKRFNYEPCTARTIDEALDMTVGMKISLLIVSLSFKDMDGPEIVQRFKTSATTETIPLLGLSRKNDPAMMHCCMQAGAADCLVQPVPAEQLYRTVQKATEVKPRKDIRIRTLQPVKIGQSLPETFEAACILDLSERGVFLHAMKQPPVNATLSLHIDLNHVIIPVEAVVVYSYQAPGGPSPRVGMGLEFVKIAPEDQGYIRQFIRDEVTRGIAPVSA